MRKILRFTLLFCSVLAGLLIISVSDSQAAADILSMDSPIECPTDGCAAGQRINFLLDFQVNTKYTSGPNTQICVYTTADGESGGDGAWAEFNRISDVGLKTNEEYEIDDPKNVCSANSDEKTLTNVCAQLPDSATSDQLELVLTIFKKAQSDGHVRVEIFQADEKGAFDSPVDDTEDISVAARATTTYVSQTPDGCDDNSPCYVNSGDDEPDGIGTGLRDAINAMYRGEIIILNDYFIKDHAVLVDKNLTIRGDPGARITYNGDQYGEPMLIFQAGGLIKDLTMDDGHWEYPSRILIQANTAEDLTIEHNTLTSASRAVDIKNNTGSVIVVFNHIIDNDGEAIYSTNTSGKLTIYANNIINNGNAEQIHCSNNDSANHNYWGEETDAEESAPDCDVSNGMQLGAPILISTGGAGVEALTTTVTDTISYDIFDNDIGFKHTNGNDFEIVIVNHGEGDESNIPFLEEAGGIDPCSNFYDVFLTENANATNLVLSLKYDLTTSCRIKMESSDYCGQDDDMSKYPLWWYDPAYNVTDGWDRTGQNPEGNGAGSATHQKTVCDMDNNTINVTIDNSGRPGLTKDLSFTPFVTGLPLSTITVSKFTGEYINLKTYLNWTTTREKNIKEFRIHRSKNRTSDYSLIASGIEAIGNVQSDSTIYYTYEDSKILSNETYYYKLEIINDLGDSLKTYGPVEILTSNPTKTATLYPTQTPIYDPDTATPRKPTQIRTYRSSPIPSRTNYIKPTAALTSTSTIDTSYGYPADTSTPSKTEQCPTQDIEGSQTDTPTVTDESSAVRTTGASQGERQFGWAYLLIGAIGGLGLLIIISVILMKSHLS